MKYASSSRLDEGTAWLAIVAGDGRQHGGNDGYDDVVERYYGWDSTVAHHAEVRAGDLIVLWDKQSLIGASLIQRVTIGSSVKALRKCPNCGKASFKPRKTKSPAFLCFVCHETFSEEQAVEVQKAVVTYRADYADDYVNLRDVLSGQELRNLCVNSRSQHSLRLLLWGRFSAAVRSRAEQGAGLNLPDYIAQSRDG